MSPNSIYREAINPPTGEDKAKAIEAAKLIAASINEWNLWRMANKTKELITVLETKQQQLLEAAMKNPDKSTNMLVEAGTLQKVLNATLNGVYE